MPPDPRFQRGAKPSPRHVLLRATPHVVTVAPPPEWAYVPRQLSVWGNDQYGDCHSADTEVLTEKGWVGWPDYDGASLLGTMNRQTGLLEFQAPLRAIRREHDGLMAYAEHRRMDFAVTPNHRMYHRPYSRGRSEYGPYQFQAVDSLPCQFSLPLATAGFVGTTLATLGIGGREWDGDDLLKLLAVIVSDGWVGDGSQIEFCCFREDRYAKVADLARRLGVREKPSAKGVWRLSDRGLAEWLRANAYVGDRHLSPFKRVPDLVKVADQRQIEAFLDFFGDQTTLSDGRRNFCSTSKRLIDDLQELLLRVGKAGTIYAGYAHRGVLIKGRWVECHNPCYTLHQAKHREVCLHQVRNGDGASNLRWGHYTGEVFCATVPNSTLVTRRNGRVLVSSNCVTAEEAFAKACYDPEIFIDDRTVIGWARSHGFLDGANLAEVMDAMQRKGFQVGAQLYDDGAYSGVDYSNEQTLQSAISQGPVKIAIDADALPSDAGQKQGWYDVQGGRFPNTDHCVALSGYGRADYLYDRLGISLAAGLAPSTPGYLLFTWGTQGFVTHPWLMGTCVEAWVRHPTTVGVPPLPEPAPPAPPTPDPPTPPVPVPPEPTPQPPTPPPVPPPDPRRHCLMLFLQELMRGTPVAVAVAHYAACLHQHGQH